MSSNQLKRKVGGVSANALKSVDEDSKVEPPRIKGVCELLEEAGLAFKKEEKKYGELKETLEATIRSHEEIKLELQNLKTWKEDIRKFLAAPHQVPFHSSVGGKVNSAGADPFQVYLAFTPPLILTEAFPALGELLESESQVHTGRSVEATTTVASQLPQVLNTGTKVFCGPSATSGQMFNFGGAGVASEMHFNVTPLNENNRLTTLSGTISETTFNRLVSSGRLRLHSGSNLNHGKQNKHTVSEEVKKG